MYGQERVQQSKTRGRPRPVSHAELRHLGSVHRHPCRNKPAVGRFHFSTQLSTSDAYPDPKPAKNHCSGTVFVEFGQREAVTQEDIPSLTRKPVEKYMS